MKVITFKVWRRPDMYKQVLDALAKCDGIEDYKIIVSIDKDPAQSFAQKMHIKVSDESPLASQILNVASEHQMGCAGNTKKAMDLGFASGADFVIHLEDDTLPSKDFLRYMEFCNERFKDDPNIFCVVGFNRRLDADKAGELALVGTRKSPVTYQAWGTWRRIWEEVSPEWFGIRWRPDYKHPDDSSLVPEGDEFLNVIEKTDQGSWGYPMLKYFPKGRIEVFPYISRCQNIGSVRGLFNVSPEWHKANIWMPIWAENDSVDSYEVR